MIGDRERGAGAGVEQLVAELVAHAEQSVLAQRAIDVHRAGDVADAVLGEHDDNCGAARFVERDEIAAHLVDLTHVGQRAGGTRTDPLQVVVEMRQVDQRQRRVVLALRRPSTPRQSTASRRSKPAVPRSRTAETCPSSGLQLVAQGSRNAVDVRQLASVGQIHRPRRDADVRRRIHVEPPEHVGAGEGRILARARSPRSSAPAPVGSTAARSGPRSRRGRTSRCRRCRGRRGRRPVR